MIKILTDKKGLITVCHYDTQLKRFESEHYKQAEQARLVFIGEDIVIKIDHKPSSDWTTRQTAKEIEFWESLKEDKEFFAEVIEHGRTPQGFWYIAQKRYTPTLFLSEMRETLKKLRLKYNLSDIWTDDCYTSDYDWHFENWFPNGDKPVIIDWGGC